MKVKSNYTFTDFTEKNKLLFELVKGNKASIGLIISKNKTEVPGTKVSKILILQER